MTSGSGLCSQTTRGHDIVDVCRAKLDVRDNATDYTVVEVDDGLIIPPGELPRFHHRAIKLRVGPNDGVQPPRSARQVVHVMLAALKAVAAHMVTMLVGARMPTSFT